MIFPADSYEAIIAELRATVIRSAPIEPSDCEAWAARIERLDAEMRKRIQNYRERLEVTGHYVMDKATDELVRVDNPPDVDEKYDGIYCRDTTIKVLSEEMTNLRTRLAAYEKTLQLIVAHDPKKHPVSTARNGGPIIPTWKDMAMQALAADASAAGKV